MERQFVRRYFDILYMKLIVLDRKGDYRDRRVLCLCSDRVGYCGCIVRV